MANVSICDHCKQEIKSTDMSISIKVRVSKILKNINIITNRYLTQDMHEDCFNYKMSTNIREKLSEEIAEVS